MKCIETKNAVGHVLCHDLTQIIKDQYKGARFQKGHVVQPEDIPVLLSMGKEHLYVWEMTEGMVHENDAAERLLALCANDHMERSAVKEGKIELTAACDGLFRVDSQRLLDRKEEFLTVMRTIRQDRHFNTVVLMITDVLLEGTQLLFVGDEETIRQAFNIKTEENCAFLPHIMSRKKQVIPMLSALWG